MGDSGAWVGWLRGLSVGDGGVTGNPGGGVGSGAVGWGGWGAAEVLIQQGEAAGVFVVGRLEQLGGAVFADDGASGEDLRGLACGGEAVGDLGLEAVDQHATADGGARGHGGVQTGDGDHGIADRCAGVEHPGCEVLEFASVGPGGRAGVGMAAGDDGHHRDISALELLGHFDGDDIAAAG